MRVYEPLRNDLALYFNNSRCLVTKKETSPIDVIVEILVQYIVTVPVVVFVKIKAGSHVDHDVGWKVGLGIGRGARHNFA